MGAPRLTQRQAAVIGAYTKIICGPLNELQAYIEEIMGRPVWTHELGGGLWDEVREAARDDFMAIVREEG